MKYIDTSAFIKYYGKEEFEKGVKKVTKLIEDAKTQKETLLSSIFMIGEAISVFDRWLRIKAITSDEFSKILSRFLTDLKILHESGSLILEPIDTLVFMLSVEFIIKHHIPINDAIHLYTALSYKTELSEFICSDQNLLKAAKVEGLKVNNPEK
jgi:predicted nucleic acid-binding protein